MNKYLLALALLSGTALLPGQTTMPGFRSMKINATDLPSFPPTLIARGITEGVARVVVRIDETGKMDDWLVTGYSHPALAQSAVAALKRWEFTPATLEGQPVSAQAEVAFDFRVDGVVISQNMTEHFLDHITRNRGGPALEYQPCSLRELDRIPTPVNVVSPFYSDEMVAAGMVGEVSVDFYIDEQGQVRMPMVSPNQHPDLSAVALAAVREWSFEPPTRRGKPVLVLARQHFRFQPGEPATAVAPPSS